MRVAAVVLAAGASSRLGEAKQLVRLGAENLLERAVRVARDGGVLACRGGAGGFGCVDSGAVCSWMMRSSL